MPSNAERLLEWYQRKMLGETAPTGGKPVQSISIVGAGMMGIEIAVANQRCGIGVKLADANAQTLNAAPKKIALEHERYASPLLAAFEGRSGEGTSAIADSLQLVTNDEVLCRSELILETIVENPAIKRQVYRRLESRLNSETLLATNTSTIPIGELAVDLKNPGRFCGIHFCHPVSVNPLVEIIPGPQTSPATVSAAIGYVQLLGKMPIVVEDGPGFLVNRLLYRYTDEALHLLMDGVSIEAIDDAATRFGMAFGPLHIMDEIGLDTSLAAGLVLLNAFPERVEKLPILPLLVKQKQLGQKSGGGFYRYEPATPETLYAKLLGPNPKAFDIIEHYAKRENPPSETAIQNRLFFAMLLEATLLLEEKKDLDPRMIDLALICGLGFPATRGGLLHWADETGLSKILETLKFMACLGKRFEPPPRLRMLAENQRRFYE
jgi:3-hydroxyacyl-CoA dehydrogenase